MLIVVLEYSKMVVALEYKMIEVEVHLDNQIIV